MENESDLIGRRLRIQRVRKGLRLEDVAKKSGVCKSQISRIEKDTIKVRLRDFVALCVAMDVNPVQLLCGSENWNPKEVAL